MLDAYHCANCGRAIEVPEQKFCPDCGQPTPAHRIDWHFLGHELEHSVLHMDRGILYTLRNLMLRPGHLMRDYLEGRRAGIVKPLLLVMMMAAAVALLTKYVAGTVPIEMPTRASGLKSSAAGAHFVTMAMDWMNNHFAAITVMTLPVQAAMFRLAFRRFRELNYPEWLVMSSFLMAQGFVIWVIVALVQRWIPGLLGKSMVVMMLYVAFSLMQFFRGYPRWKTLLRTLVAYAITMLAQGILGASIAVVVGIVMGFR